jgi:general stress protein 26
MPIMNTTENMKNKKAIDKLKSLVDDIKVCLFCTNINAVDGATCRPMTAIKVCNEGNIWFFSEKNSDKNKAIAVDKDVQLYFSDPAKSSYLVVYGKAKKIMDKATIEELWTNANKIWFKEGKKDPNISVIKVTPKTAYYWDTDDNRMISFLKMIASVATGINLVNSNHGALKI